MPRLPGFRRAPDGEAAPPPPTPRAVRRALPPAGQLRRERRSLLQLRETRLRDLGGLMLEMYRRGQFRRDPPRVRRGGLQRNEGSGARPHAPPPTPPWRGPPPPARPPAD